MNGISGAALGASFLASGLGSSLGTVRSGGLDLDPQWYSWLSPIGWGQLAQPFAVNDWWLLGGFALVAAVVSAGAFAVAVRRDLGHGLLAARAGTRTLVRGCGCRWV